MMRVLVTGGTGFLGQHVVRELKLRGHDPLVLNRKGGAGLLNREWTKDMIEDAEAEAVIHLAAKCGGIGANLDKPGEFFYDNMLMGLNLIEACRIAAISKTVVVGTVCAYPKHTPVPFKEESLWSGFPESSNAPYGIAKKALLVMLQAYRQQYGMNGIYLIPVNIYGQGDSFNPHTSHVIPALIRKFHAAVKEEKDIVECWGTGSASREFLYVEDAARGIVDGLEKYDGPEPINLGSGSEITIHDLTNLIASMTEFCGKIVWDPSKPDGQPRRCLDVSRAKDLLGFKVQMNLLEGLQKTYQWYVDDFLGSAS